MTEDYYELLGVGRDSSTEEIKRAHRKKAARYHPDVSEDPDAGEQFKRIQKAKDVLTDERTRRAYDRIGHERYARPERDAGVGNDATSAGRGPQTGPRRVDPFGPGFEWMGGTTGVGTLFDQFFGRRPDDPFRNERTTTVRTRGPRPRQGADLHATIEVELEEAYHGTRKQVTLTRADTCSNCDGNGHVPGSEPHQCPKCNGRGHVIHIEDSAFGRTKRTEPCGHCHGEGELPGDPCTKCGGDGQVQREVTFDVDVPAGAECGQTLLIENEGDLGRHGGARGDFLADVEVNEHPEFTRDGDDLYTGYPLSFPQAVFGTTVEVPTLDRSVSMTVPAGTQSGETFQLRGEGMPQFQQPGQGDLYVRVQVVTPDELTAEQRELLDAYARASRPDAGRDVSNPVEE